MVESTTATIAATAVEQEQEQEQEENDNYHVTMMENDDDQDTITTTNHYHHHYYPHYEGDGDGGRGIELSLQQQLDGGTTIQVVDDCCRCSNSTSSSMTVNISSTSSSSSSSSMLNYHHHHPTTTTTVPVTRTKTTYLPPALQRSKATKHTTTTNTSTTTTTTSTTNLQETPLWMLQMDYLGKDYHFGNHSNNKKCTASLPSSSQSSPPSRWQRGKAEVMDLIQELIHYTKTKHWKKKVLTIIVCASSLLVFIDLLFFGTIVTWLQAFILWMESNVLLGIICFVVLFTVTTLVFIPPSILTFGCGYVMAHICNSLWEGIVAATLVCFIGSVLGAVIAFGRARYMMRDLVELFARRYTLVRAIDVAIQRNEFRVMVLLRLCPLIPFHALNYIGGITAVSAESFTMSMIGILPTTILTTTIGATTEGILNGNSSSRNRNSSNSDDQELVRILLLCSGLATVIIAMVITYYFARKELQRELQAIRLLEQEEGIEVSEAGTAAATTAATTVEQGEGTSNESWYPLGTLSFLQPQDMEEVEDEEWFWMFT